jgi:hypothetical protein
LDKIQEIEKLFYYINASLYLILPLFYFIFKNKKGDSLVIALYGTLCFFLLVSYYYLPNFLIDPYLFFYTFLEYTFFTLLICSNIKNKVVKKIILSLSILFFAFQIRSIIRVEIDRLDTFSIGIETILLFIYIIYTFYEYFKNSKSTYIYNNHFFWVSLGILIYLGGTFFFNILANHLSRDQLVQYLKLTYILEMIKTLLFGVSIVMYSYHQKENVVQNPNLPYLDLDMN